MSNEKFETFIESALKRHSQAPRVDSAENLAAVERVHARLSGALPRQKVSLWRLPAALLDWQFAPAWPRVAALACCAMLGFMIGIAGVDRHFAGPNSAYAIASRADLGSIVFDPEALTGARP